MLYVSFYENLVVHNCHVITLSGHVSYRAAEDIKEEVKK